MEVIYYFFCFIHKTLKKAFGKENNNKNLEFVDITKNDYDENFNVNINKNSFISSTTIDKYKLNHFYPTENPIIKNTSKHLKRSYKSNLHNPKKDLRPVENLWKSFIERAEIPHGYKNEGLFFGGFIKSNINNWCLPSWVWTNAALVKYFCSINDLKKAEKLTDILLKKQDIDGSWEVRSEFHNEKEIPIKAPNDSSYIANNALIETYQLTKDTKYLLAAKKCADWVMAKSREDGLVWTGYDVLNKKWLKDFIIVDTGFTAGFLANLGKITNDEKYLNFLVKFVDRFIELFFDPDTGGFCTSIDKENKKYGGVFARGQAWALEGLIPTFQSIPNERLKTTIEKNIAYLIKNQLPNGGWSYNITRPYLGEDSKGVPVITKALLDWNRISPNKEIYNSAKKGIQWCKRKTSRSGDSAGGIFSYNAEGAIVHSNYTSTALIYSSAYALQVENQLKNE